MYGSRPRRRRPRSGKYDISDRKRIEEKLAEDRYRTLFENSPISLWQEDFSEVKKHISHLRRLGINDFNAYFKDHPDVVKKCADLVKVVDVNRATLELYGVGSKEFFLDGLGAFFIEASYKSFKQELLAIAKAETCCETEAVAQTTEGETKYLALRWAVVPGYEDTLENVLVSMLDITERKKAERRLHALSGQLLRLQEEERRRIARELHETIAQQLVTIRINLSLANESSGQLKTKANQALSESLLLVDQCLREIRTLSYLLRPPLLDETGLVSGLRWYVDGFSRRSGVRVDLDVLPDLGRLPREVETTIFRIVQECLTNVHLHSGSPTATIRIVRNATTVTAEVKDEGRGIPQEHIRERAYANHMMVGVGIAGMRERAEQLGGRLEIPRQGLGTTVKVILPLEKPRL